MTTLFDRFTRFGGQRRPTTRLHRDVRASCAVVLGCYVLPAILFVAALYTAAQFPEWDASLTLVLLLLFLAAKTSFWLLWLAIVTPLLAGFVAAKMSPDAPFRHTLAVSFLGLILVALILNMRIPLIAYLTIILTLIFSHLGAYSWCAFARLRRREPRIR